MPSATSDLPEPVGVPRITWSPAARFMRASSWCSQSSMPRSSHQPRKRSKASSAVHQGSGSSPSAGSHQLGERAPSEPCSPVLPVPAANELAEDPAVAAADAFAVSAVLAMEMMPFGFALGASCVACCINYGRWLTERHGVAPAGRWRSGDLSRAGGPRPVYSSIACPHGSRVGAVKLFVSLLGTFFAFRPLSRNCNPQSCSFAEAGRACRYGLEKIFPKVERTSWGLARRACPGPLCMSSGYAPVRFAGDFAG